MTASSREPAPVYFESAAAFRAWLEENHERAREVWVGFHRKATGRPSMTWEESVGEALCYGWIDGIRKSVDGDRYRIRFTPRRTGSNWSAVNIRRARELIELGLMRPPGLAAFEQRDRKRAARYSFERNDVAFDPVSEGAFRRNARAWKFFQEQPPYYRKTVTWWVMSAARPATRERRLRTLIDDSAAGRRIAALRRDPGTR